MFGEIVGPAVLGGVPAGGQEGVEGLLGDVRHLAVVLPSHTPRPTNILVVPGRNHMRTREVTCHS